MHRSFLCVGKRHCSLLDKHLSRHSPQCPFLTAVQLLLSSYQSSSSIPAPLTDYTAQLPNCTCVTDEQRAAVMALLPAVTFYHHHRVMKELSHIEYMKSTSTVQPGTVIITMDFKENIKINTAPDEPSRLFYEQSLRSVLGFYLVFINPRTQQVHHQYIDIISSSLTHDATFALECLDRVVRDYVLPLGMPTAPTVHLWCDRGRHFDCDEFAAGALVSLRLVHAAHSLDTHLHYFTEKHGKSPVDGHFSLVSRWLRQAATQRLIISTQDLITALQQQAESHLQAQRRPEQATHGITFIPFTPICQQHQAGWHDAVVPGPSSSSDGDESAVAHVSEYVSECVSESVHDPFAFPPP